MERVFGLVGAGWLVSAAAAAAIVVLSLIPAGDWYHGLGVEGLDHYLAYAGLSFLVLLRCQGRSAWAVRIIAIMALGVVIELVQPYFHRGMELPDIIANAAGIASGALLVVALRSLLAVVYRHMHPVLPVPIGDIGAGLDKASH